MLCFTKLLFTIHKLKTNKYIVLKKKKSLLSAPALRATVQSPLCKEKMYKNIYKKNKNVPVSIK